MAAKVDRARRHSTTFGTIGWNFHAPKGRASETRVFARRRVVQDGADVPLRAGHYTYVHGVVSSGAAAFLLPLEASAIILGVW